MLKAWLENIGRKMVDQSRCKEAFDALRAIVYLRCEHGASDDERSKAVQDAISDFKNKFSNEVGMLKYFDSYWEPKQGEELRHKVQQDVPCVCSVTQAGAIYRLLTPSSDCRNVGKMLQRACES